MRRQSLLDRTTMVACAARGHGRIGAGMRTTVVLTAAAAALVLASGASGQQPAFTQAPDPAIVCQQVTFTWVTEPDSGASNWEWDLDGDGQFDDATGEVAETTYTSSGPHTAQLQVTYAGDPSTVAQSGPRTVTVEPSVPTASFIFSPTAPLISELVTFTSTSSPPAGQTITALDWDLDGDGEYDDGSGGSTGFTYSTSGDKSVGLQVQSGCQGQLFPGQVAQTVPVQNRAPTAQITASRSTPLADEKVTFVSGATDPDGDPLTQKWDLNGDGSFDDASGSTASRSYASKGKRTVGLRVEDPAGASAEASTSLQVRLLVPVITAKQAPVSPQAAQGSLGSSIMTTLRCERRCKVTAFAQVPVARKLLNLSKPKRTLQTRTVKRTLAARVKSTLSLTFRGSDLRLLKRAVSRATKPLKGKVKVRAKSAGTTIVVTKAIRIKR